MCSFFIFLIVSPRAICISILYLGTVYIESDNINTVGDLKSQTYESLLATPGIAKHSIDTLSNFASNLKADPDKFLEIYNAEKNGTKIPSNPDFNEPFLKLFKDTIDDYIKIFKWN